MPNGDQHYPPPPLWEQVKTLSESLVHERANNTSLHKVNADLERRVIAAESALAREITKRTVGTGGTSG